jgi:hypothetical protein
VTFSEKENRMNSKKRWLAVALFSAAMAWVEAAVVFYLRVMIDRVQPYQADPLPAFGSLGQAELVREAATLGMLLCVGWLAGNSSRTRLSYAMLAFGVWDILYYVFLIPLTGWPGSLADWDILFLLPLPWWGPVLAPVSIAALMVLTGALISQGCAGLWPKTWAWGVSLPGVLLALYAFMADALSAVMHGNTHVRALLPERFNWPLFSLAILLMAAPLADMLWQHWHTRLRRLPETGHLVKGYLENGQ